VIRGSQSWNSTWRERERNLPMSLFRQPLLLFRSPEAAPRCHQSPSRFSPSVTTIVAHALPSGPGICSRVFAYSSRWPIPFAARAINWPFTRVSFFLDGPATTDFSSSGHSRIRGTVKLTKSDRAPSDHVIFVGVPRPNEKAPVSAEALGLC